MVKDSMKAKERSLMLRWGFRVWVCRVSVLELGVLGFREFRVQGLGFRS